MDLFRIRAALFLRTMVSNDTTVAKYVEMHLDDTSTFMGLEGHINPNRIRERRSAVGRAVHLEQLHQGATGVFDPDAMRRASEEITGESFRRARVVAMIHGPNDDKR